VLRTNGTFITHQCARNSSGDEAHAFIKKLENY